MTGFDQKLLQLSHDGDQPLTVRLEVDYSNWDFWKVAETLTVPPGETVAFRFPPGYQAHWIRLVPNRSCLATAQLTYE